jgi:hypothetical protein
MGRCGPGVRRFLAVARFNLVIEGKGLKPALEEMEKSGEVRVLGPHISRYYPGAGVNGSRMVVKVESDNAAEAREVVRGYLPADGDFTIGPA